MSKGKILVIDDSPLVRKLAEVSLQEAGYEVFTADNGEDGLKIAEKEMPDLILVDFIMPKMTGSQFCLLLKEKEKLKDIPILLITGKGEAVGQAFIEKYGVQDYFIKPFKSEDLVERVDFMLGKILPKEKIEEIQSPITEKIDIEQPTEEKITEIFEPELKLIPEEESFLPEKPLEKIDISPTEEITPQIPEEKTIEFPFLEETEEAPVENYEETFEKEIQPPDIQDEVQSLVPEEPELYEKPLIEEKIEEITYIPEEIFDIEEKIEEVKISEEAEKIPVTIEKTPSQEIPLSKEEVSESQIEVIGKIIEDKLNEFYDKINELIKYSIEINFKKFGIIKEDKVILGGKTSAGNVEELMDFISRSKLTGFLTFFSYDVIFEFLLIEGKIVYGIASSLKSKFGNKFLKDFTAEEIKELTSESLAILLKTKIDSFILEEREKSDTYLDSLPRYDIKEFI